MADTTSGRRSLIDLRAILWLGFLVAAWLLLAPTSTADGRSCGTPVFHLSHPGPDEPQLADETCVDRNFGGVVGSAAAETGSRVLSALPGVGTLGFSAADHVSC